VSNDTRKATRRACAPKAEHLQAAANEQADSKDDFPCRRPPFGRAQGNRARPSCFPPSSRFCTSLEKVSRRAG